jgi:hypothetical protein
VLAPGGVIVVSAPYLNGVRRLGVPWICRQQAAVRDRGGSFYQYAFTRRELVAVLRDHGFAPARRLRVRFRPGSAEPWRRACRAMSAVLVRGAEQASPRMASPEAHCGAVTPAARGGLARTSRRLPYTEPALRLLGHMLLVVAPRS